MRSWKSCRRRWLGGEGERPRGRSAPHLPHGCGFDLADPLTAQGELSANGVERARLPAVKPVAQPQDGALAIIEWSKGLLYLMDKSAFEHRLLGRHGRGVAEDVPQFPLRVLPQRCRQGHR